MSAREIAETAWNPLPPRRVVVTGIGLVTPFGAGRETSWQAIQAGRSAVKPLMTNGRQADSRAEARWVGAPAPELFESELPGDVAYDDLVVRMALLAANEAIEHSGLARSRVDADRSGVVIGTSKPNLRTFAADFREQRRSPWNWWPDSACSMVASHFGWRGATLCPVAACATGLVSVIRAANLIRSDDCDVVLAGSSDASLVPIVLGSFQRLGVLARGFAEPAQACRPFDAERSGFVIGEGAAVLAIESFDHALARGATILAEFVAGGLASDPSGLMQVESDGSSLSRLIRDVLRRGGLSTEDIDYINLHGTATRANDLVETRAIRSAFGSHADRLLCSSQKGAIGHLLGAAGSVETAVSLLALRDQFVPPTANLLNPDPQCDLDYVAGSGRSARLRQVMKLSLGFGGHLAAAVFRELGTT